MAERQNEIMWIVDNETGIVTAQELPFGERVVPWATSVGPITNNIMVDPRDYGAKCTGCYGIQTASIFRAGTGWAVGDRFIATDLLIEGHVRGGKNATGHITSINSTGGVTGFVFDEPGSGYFLSALYVTPITGVGQGFAINPTSLYTPPSAPTTSLASGGGSTAAFNGSYVPGGTYAAGDIFAIPNPAEDGNYMTGRVTTVNSNGAVLTYTINNPGGDYKPMPGVRTITLTGYGSGLTINILSTTSANGSWDDTYGFMAAAVAANAVGGAVLMPDNSWVSNLMPPAGTTIMGQGWGVNYSYANVPNGTSPSTRPHMFIIGTPNFGIDFNAQGNIALVAFEIRGYTGNGFGANTTWDSTCAVGSFVGGGGGQGAKVWLYQMSTKNCRTGLGSKDGTGAFIFCVSQNSDYGACYEGIFGPFSDFLSFGDTFASNVVSAIHLPASGGGLLRIMYPRIEYCNVGIWLESGGLQCDIIGAQFDRIVYIGLYAKDVALINHIGGNMKGCGLAGSLTVTNATDNGSGLIRLTVTGFGQVATGGGTPLGGLATGQKVNVSGIVGTTEANANQWTFTKINNTTMDLQGSTFSNAYVSGGFAAAGNNASYVVLDTVTDYHAVGVGFYGYSAGVNLSAGNVIDALNCSRISIDGGTANPGNGNQGGWLQAFANWNNSGNTPPANVRINVTNNNTFNNDVGVTPTTVSGSTSGSVVFSQPEGTTTVKRVLGYCNNLTGTASYTFPTAFSQTPQIVTTNGPAAAVVTALTTSATTFTGSGTTGFIELIGF